MQEKFHDLIVNDLEPEIVYAYAETTLSNGTYETIFTRVNLTTNEHTGYSFNSQTRMIRSFLCHKGLVYFHLLDIYYGTPEATAGIAIYNDKSSDPFGYNHKCLNYFTEVSFSLKLSRFY